MKINFLLMMLLLGIHFPSFIIAQNFESDSFPEISISMKENVVTVSVNLNKKFTWEGVMGVFEKVPSTLGRII